MRRIFRFLSEAGQNWLEDKAPRLGAALAFYSIISIGPLLVIVIAIAGTIFGHEAASERIIASLGGLVGAEGAEGVRMVVENSQKETSGIIATIVGIGALIFGASGVFGELQDALNTIWQVKTKPRQHWLYTLKKRFLSFGMVLGTGFLLLISLVVSTALTAMGNYFEGLFPGFDTLLQLLNFLVSFAFITFLFALIFKVLPDARIRWNDVWVGAAFTALLFSIGKFIIGLYLGHSSIGETYGAAGSFIIFLIWTYYSAQIVFFGAEMTEVYANHFGAGVRPDKNALKIAKKEVKVTALKRKKPKH